MKAGLAIPAILVSAALALTACGSARGTVIVEVPAVEGPEAFRADIEAAVLALFDHAPDAYRLVRRHVWVVVLVDDGRTLIEVEGGRLRFERSHWEAKRAGDASVALAAVAALLVHEATHRDRWVNGLYACTAEEERAAILAERAAFLKLADPADPPTAAYAKMLQDAADHARPPCTP